MRSLRKHGLMFSKTSHHGKLPFWAKTYLIWGGGGGVRPTGLKKIYLPRAILVIPVPPWQQVKTRTVINKTLYTLHLSLLYKMVSPYEPRPKPRPSPSCPQVLTTAQASNLTSRGGPSKPSFSRGFQAKRPAAYLTRVASFALSRGLGSRARRMGRC